MQETLEMIKAMRDEETGQVLFKTGTFTSLYTTEFTT